MKRGSERFFTTRATMVIVGWSVVSGLSLALALVACSSDKESDGQQESDSSDSSETISEMKCPVVVKESDCDTAKLPFVFVHGTFGSGDQIGKMAMLFGSNGYCQERFVAVEYNSLGGSPLDQLDALIDRVREETGADQVELAGHSQGTAHCGTYMSDSTRAAKIAHYINFSGSPGVPVEIPTLSISSNNDLGNTTHHASGSNVEAVTLDDEDHVTLASSVNSFKAVWTYLYGEEPEYTTIQCGEDPVTIEGIAETFGDNVPVNGKLEVYELDYRGAPQKRGKPVMTVLSTSSDGHVDPIQLKRGVPYEFKAWDANGALIGYVYFPPFKRNNYLTRFLKPSDNPLVSMMSTSNIVKSPDHVAMVGRNIGGAFRRDLDHSLVINDTEVLTEDTAGRADTVVGFFMYDANSNKSSDLGAVFGPGAFLVGTDVYVDATSPAWIEIEWDDPESDTDPLTMKIPNWPSSEALNLVYFLK